MTAPVQNNASTRSPAVLPEVALLTKHGKSHIVEPILQAAFDTRIINTDAFDTDELGTFDNRIARTLSPINAALKKAYLACELTGCKQGIGSEGSFNGFITGATVNHEVLAFVDIEKKLEVIAFAEQFLGLRAIEAKHEVELADKIQPFIEQFGDTQKWLVKQNDTWLKGLDYSELLNAIKEWPCTLEPDFRAMNCPSRQNTIAMATKDLVRRLQSPCPKCNSVNFVEKFEPENVAYLPCELCASETTKRVPPRVKCDACGYIEPKDEEAITASAMYCTVCNP